MTEETPDQANEESILLALEAIQKFAFNGRMAEARAYLTELWPFIGTGIDLVQDPDKVNVYSGIALGYLRLGNLVDAKKFANSALILSPTDMLAHAISPLKDRIQTARQFIHYQQPEKAIDLLKTIQTLTPDTAEETDFYLHLLRHYETEKAKARLLAPLDGRATLFSLALWGEAYVEKFLRWSLPSLLAPGNVPALAATDPVIFDIYTTEVDRARLAASPSIQALAEIARIDYLMIPDEFSAFKETAATRAPDRLYVSGAQSLSAVKAKALGADLTFVCTEGLYSDRHFTAAKSYLRAGYKAVLMISLRARDGGLAEYLDNKDAVAGNAIVLDVKHLLDYTVNNLNPQLHDMFIRPDSRPINQDVVALYFKTATGFAARTYQLSPALISHEIIPADLEFDYFTADARFYAELAMGEDPARIFKVIDNPAADLFVVDLDSETDGTARPFGEAAVTVEQCVRSALSWCIRESDFHYFEWAFKQRFEFNCDSATLPDNGNIEAETVAEFFTRFKASQEDSMRKIVHIRGDV